MIDPTVLALMQQHNPEAAQKFMEMTTAHKVLRKFVTHDPKMLQMKKDVVTLSLVDDPVLIHGPSGTGKEIIARALHGDRPEGSFIAINCAGIPEALAESELFGHAKGAFTGATENQRGMFHAANKGTLFLDEIGELPLGTQAKLLRALADRRARSVGSFVEYTIDCRVIAATHRNLKEMITGYAPRFREDLYYRLSTFEISTTPLEQRTGDIALIVCELDIENRIPDIDAFVSKINPKQLGGNVRRLEQLVRRYYVLGKLPE